MNDNFELLKTIEGGFGTIDVVKHKSLSYVRAIKKLKINNPNEQLRRDFINECKTLSLLGTGLHPNIIKIYQFQIDNLPYYIEMDYVEGENFDKYAEKNFLSFNEVCRFIKNIAGALAYCHNYKDETGNLKSIVHNDLHSANIIKRKEDGEYILLDFGLAIENGDIIRSSKRSAGWCEFMSPERSLMELQGVSPDGINKATPAWDIYSLGCLIFVALTGRAPFALGKTCATDYLVLQSHCDVDKLQPWKKIREYRHQHFVELNIPGEYHDDIPGDWLINIVAKCLSKNASERYQNAQELLDDFNMYYYKQNISYDAYIEEQNRRKLIEEERDELVKYCNVLENEKIELKNRSNVPIKRTWIVSFVIVFALICNCVPPLQANSPYITQITYLTYLISALASVVILGIAIYDTVKQYKK